MARPGNFFGNIKDFALAFSGISYCLITALADALHVSADLLLYQESQNAQIQTLTLMLEGQSPEFVDGIIELVRTCIANFDSKEDKI